MTAFSDETGRQWLWRVYNLGFPKGHEDSTNTWGGFQIISHDDAVRLAMNDDNGVYEFVPYQRAKPAALSASPVAQEPVAWRHKHSGWRDWKYTDEKPEGPSIHLFKVEALYTSPPATSAGLGADEIAREAVAAMLARMLYNDATLDDCTAEERASWLAAADAIREMYRQAAPPVTSASELKHWRDISTAPEDDCDILVGAWLKENADGEFDEAAASRWVQVISSREDRPFRRGYRHRNGACWATHWHPLPASRPAPILALLSRAGDQSNSTQKDGSR